MTVQQLDQITPRSLFNKLQGFRAGQQMDWERTRIQTYLMLTPHMKEGTGITPQSLMPMPWDDAIEELQRTTAKEIREKSKALWDRIDEDKKRRAKIKDRDVEQ